MKFVKWFIIVVAVIFGLFVAVTFFLPKEYYVERSTEIEAPALVVYMQAIDLEAWQTWSPWTKYDPDMSIIYGEKKAGTGAFYSWKSDVTGDGTMTIIDSKSPEFVRYELIFEGYEDQPGFASIILAAASPMGPTKVTWTYEGNVGDKFFARWLAVLMDKFLGPGYEEGLANLKAKSEAISESPGLELP
ncbi:MAG: SRPBCC family protein [Opitutales bacterium]|jgi:hypothetical protein